MNLLARAGPLLSNLLPAAISVKGLSRIDPRFSKFIYNALSSGYGAENVVDYLRDRMAPEGDKMENERLEQGSQQGSLTSQERVALAKRRQEKGTGKAIAAGVGILSGLGGLSGGGQQQEQAPQQAQSNNATSVGQMQNQPPAIPEKQLDPISTLRKFSPNLAAFISTNVQQGKDPKTAAILAAISDKFNDPIKKIQKQTKENFEDYVDSLFGSQSQGQPDQNQPMEGNPPQPGRLSQEVLDVLKELKRTRRG